MLCAGALCRGSGELHQRPPGAAAAAGARTARCTGAEVSLVPLLILLLFYYTLFLPRGKVRPADKLQVKAATILPLDGLARSKQDPIILWARCSVLYCPPSAGANILSAYRAPKIWTQQHMMAVQHSFIRDDPLCSAQGLCRTHQVFYRHIHWELRDTSAMCAAFMSLTLPKVTKSAFS